MAEMDTDLRRLSDIIALIEGQRTPSGGDPLNEDPWDPPQEYRDLARERLFVMRDIVAHIAKGEGYPTPETLDDDRFRQLVEEAIDATEAWAEGPGMGLGDAGDGPPRPNDTELQRLLRQQYDLNEQMIDIFEAWLWGR
jgi:hypothetical protein